MMRAYIFLIFAFGFVSTNHAQTVLQPLIVNNDGIVTVQVQEFTMAKNSPDDRSIDPISLIARKDILEHLELVPQQKLQLADMQKRMQQEFIAGMQEVSELGGTQIEIQKRMIKKWNELNSSAIEQLEQVLLPHQTRVFRELQLKNNNRKYGIKGLLLNDHVISELNISAQQQNEIEGRIRTVEKELEKKIELLRQDAQKKVTSILSLRQQNRLSELLGEKEND